MTVFNSEMYWTGLESSKNLTHALCTAKGCNTTIVSPINIVIVKYIRSNPRSRQPSGEWSQALMMLHGEQCIAPLRNLWMEFVCAFPHETSFPCRETLEQELGNHPVGHILTLVGSNHP